MELTSSIFYRCWSESESESELKSGPVSKPIVFVHGLFGSIENLGMIIRLLKDEFSIYAIDLPNHGRSKHTIDTSLESMAAAMLNWMDSVGLDCVDLVGHSLGGKVCMELALRYPDRVNRLIVADIAPVAYPRRHDDVFEAYRAVDLDKITSRTDADVLMSPYLALASTRSFLLKNLEKNTNNTSTNSTDAPTDKTGNMDAPQSAWRWRVNFDALEAGYSNIISANTTICTPFTKPVLFIKGENSDYIMPEHQESILALFPNAGVKVISNTEHWLHAQKPEIFAGLVRRFLSQDRIG
jgi:esterase